jgi:predicted metal-dependent HD superfamily phosphohydrolase
MESSELTGNMWDLTRWWPLSDHHEVRRELEAGYRSPTRGYHDVRHLVEVFERLAELSVDHPFPRTEVLLAAWFHDSVYDGEPGAEERSAQWATEALADADVDVEEVVRLVRLTVEHRPEPGDIAGEALSDADLAILAAVPERYAEYAEGVRREYNQYSDRDYAVGRIAVLEGLLAAEWVYATTHARDRWEHEARSNVSRELVTLRTLAWDVAGLPDAGV